MQGFLLLNKPSGITSFGAVRKIKWLTKEKRVGHTGTLDPMATGVLPIFIGKATSLSSFLSESEKTYIAGIKLGVTTDTLDITGKILSLNAVSVAKEDILNALENFTGRQKQIPPMYSAIKKDGVKMYELARRGETAEIPERDIEVYSISLLNPLNEDNEFVISATVSKGTYIRSLARDIGEYLGCGAVLSSLCRTSVSGFDIKNAVSLDDLTEENMGEYIKKEDTAIENIERVSVSFKQGIRFSNGGQLDLDRLNKKDFFDGQTVRVYSGDTFLGIGMADFNKNQLSVRCVINRLT